MSTEIPIGFTIRTRNQKGKLVYRPDLNKETPWASYRNGIAGTLYASVTEARQDGFRDLESDIEREERAKNLKELGMEIPHPLASIPETNQMSSGRLPLPKPKPH